MRLRRIAFKLASLAQGTIDPFEPFSKVVSGKHGIEVGGPSKVFSSALPVYPLVQSLDNCNFAESTVWSEHGGVFQFHPEKPPGKNFISEGSSIPVADSSYDFLLSSHNLEHFANPVKALLEWKRIAPVLILVVPDRHRTFDWKRPATTVEHMMSDYVHRTGEDDSTHFQEIIDCQDFKWGGASRNLDELKTALATNLSTRVVHHHVFDVTNLPALLEALGARVEVTKSMYPCHICTLVHWL